MANICIIVAFIFGIAGLIGSLEYSFRRSRRRLDEKFAADRRRNQEQWWVYLKANPIRSLIENENPLPSAPPVRNLRPPIEGIK